MKVAPVSGISAISGKTAVPTAGTPGTGFSGILDKIIKKAELNGISGDAKGLAGMQKILEQGKTFSPNELVLFQVKASKLHLRVELVSKSAETVHATARRLQQGQ